MEWTRARDRHARLRFEPLDEPSDTVVVVPESGPTLERSRAVLHVLRELGGSWAVMAVLAGLVPRSAADLIYRFIARNRCRIRCRSGAQPQ